MKIKNLNTKYAPQRIPKAGEIWKGKPWVGGVYLIVETGDYFEDKLHRRVPSKLIAVDLDNTTENLGTFHGIDDFDADFFSKEHDFVCLASKVKLVFPKKR